MCIDIEGLLCAERIVAKDFCSTMVVSWVPCPYRIGVMPISDRKGGFILLSSCSTLLWILLALERVHDSTLRATSSLPDRYSASNMDA